MKKVILVIMLIFLGVSTQAQEKKRNAKHTIEVDGVCMMCKKRIEKAALKSKGVKYAKWDVSSKQLTVIIDERKTDMKQIAQKIADAGHDSKEVKATLEVYNNLHGCCKYRDEEVINNHKRGKKKH